MANWTDVTALFNTPKYLRPAPGAGDSPGASVLKQCPDVWQVHASSLGNSLTLSGGLWRSGGSDRLATTGGTDWCDAVVMQEACLTAAEPILATGLRCTVRLSSESAKPLDYVPGLGKAGVFAFNTAGPYYDSDELRCIWRACEGGCHALTDNTSIDQVLQVVWDEPAAIDAVAAMSIVGSSNECGCFSPNPEEMWAFQGGWWIPLRKIELLTDSPSEFWTDFVGCREVLA